MVRILDLFSGTQSVRKALDTMDIKYDYIGIDIYSPEEQNLILDLSQDDIVDKVVAALPKGWIPDFIWASPVCARFSIATSTRGGNLYFQRTETGIKVREDMSALDWRHRNYTKEYIQGEARLHLKLVDNMQKILDYYNVDFIVENPRSSFMVHILNKLYVPNRVDYCMYGFDHKKPTTIYSNYNLDLITCNHTEHSGSFQTGPRDYKSRAIVPPLLIKQILNIFLG
jgi:hypothetical protein